MPLSPSEKEYQAQIVELAAYNKWLTYHTYDSRRSSPGFPDLVLVRSPEVVFVEVKTDRGRVSPEQQLWIESLSACPGVDAYIWRPRDWERVVWRLERPTRRAVVKQTIYPFCEHGAHGKCRSPGKCACPCHAEEVDATSPGVRPAASRSARAARGSHAPAVRARSREGPGDSQG